MTDTALTDLPEPIANYLVWHPAGDVERAITTFAPQATVTDYDETFVGIEAIRGWLAKSSTEFSYEITPLGVEQKDQDNIVIRLHLEGNFPGGQVDQRCQFTVTGSAISRLVIGPA